MKRILLWLIVFYQKQISPLHPGCCRFVPTCSEYALEAIQTWGAVRGLGFFFNANGNGHGGQSAGGRHAAASPTAGP